MASQSYFQFQALCRTSTLVKYDDTFLRGWASLARLQRDLRLLLHNERLVVLRSRGARWPPENHGGIHHRSRALPGYYHHHHSANGSAADSLLSVFCLALLRTTTTSSSSASMSPPYPASAVSSVETIEKILSWDHSRLRSTTATATPTTSHPARSGNRGPG